MAEARRKYSREFKIEAVGLLESGRSGKEVEEALGIASGMVYRWRRQLMAEGVRAFPSNGNPRDEELAQLRKEVRELREERDILRKAAAIFSRTRR